MTMDSEPAQLRYNGQGLIPAVLQDANTGEVLMVAWMNEEALQLTRETGQAHFWSRSRRTLWHKGATSGNFMNVRDILADCDADTLLVSVDPVGPACHTGERSCFHRHLAPAYQKPGVRGTGRTASRTSATAEPPYDSRILDELYEVVLDRWANRPPGSYTAQLLDAGEDEILKKVGEEAMEVIIAAKGQGDERVVSEIADLIYHLLVLLAARGLGLVEVRAELAKRRR
ncbi:MAG: bifunctional phosphoribosyl-AMP cyclohydrolase/phosphoribosyl-ATP diphosphatase HisIE [Anaerolineae bacterium]|jgi:phosphoribosyl-ATP pyrophosphohydrolase/phosphoribosyl-AMP cyclohydrolase